MGAIIRRLSDLAFSFQLARDRLLHSPLLAHSGGAIHKARFSHDHELEMLLGREAPEFGRSVHIGIGPYGRVLRIAPSPTRPEIGGILVSAPPRGGKSLGVITDLLTYSGSVIVNDVKGELFEKTAGHRSTFSTIIVLDPRGVGHRFDPLSGARTEENFHKMAGHLLTGIRADAFTIRATTMQAAIFRAAALEGVPGFVYSAHLLHLGAKATAKRLHQVSLAHNLPDGQNLATRFLDQPLEDVDFSDRYFQSAWSTLKNVTEPVYTETVIKTLAASDFTIAQLMLGPRPLTIYIRTPESSLDSLTPLVRLIWGSMLDQALQLHDDRHGNGCKPLLALIDEAGAAPLPALPRFSSTAAGRGIILKVIVQDHNQLEHAYGHANALTIINNMDTQIFFRQNGIGTAEYLQKRAGLKSDYAHSETRNPHTQTGESQSEQAVPLLPLDEITQLEDTDAIILHRNFKPIRGKRMDFRRFAEITALTHIPPPTIHPLPDVPDVLPLPGGDAELPDGFGPLMSDDD